MCTQYEKNSKYFYDLYRSDIYLLAWHLLFQSSWIRRIWLERWQWVSFWIHTTIQIEQNGFGTTGLHERWFTFSLHKIYITKPIKRTDCFAFDKTFLMFLLILDVWRKKRYQMVPRDCTSSYWILHPFLCSVFLEAVYFLCQESYLLQRVLWPLKTEQWNCNQLKDSPLSAHSQLKESKKIGKTKTKITAYLIFSL